MKKYAIVFSVLIIIFNLFACNEEQPEQPSKVNIGNTEIPVKSIQCILNQNISTGKDNVYSIPYSLHLFTEDNKVLFLHIFNKEKDKLPTGTYNFQERNDTNENDEYTFYGMLGEKYIDKKEEYIAVRSISTNENNEKDIYITETNNIIQGIIKVSAKKDIYTIEFEGIDEEQTKISFFYKGELPTEDYRKI